MITFDDPRPKTLKVTSRTRIFLKCQ